MAQRSDFSTLCRGTLLPKEVREREAVLKFLEAVDQFERIINDSGCMRLRRLPADEIAGTDDKRGLLDRYLSLRDDAAGSKTSGSAPMKCGSEIKSSACTPCPIRTICLPPSQRTAVTNGSPPIAATAG